MIRKTLNTVAPFEVAGFRIEPSSLQVIGARENARLESKAMQVLVYLVEHAGQVVSRAELEEHIWPDRIVTEDAVTNTILKLRRVLGDSARHPHVIETIPKTGYRLIAEVVPLCEADEGNRSSLISTTTKVARAWGRPEAWIAGVLLVLLLLLATWVFLTRDYPPAVRTEPSPDKPAVAFCHSRI